VTGVRSAVADTDRGGSYLCFDSGSPLKDEESPVAGSLHEAGENTIIVREKGVPETPQSNLVRHSVILFTLVRVPSS